MERRDDAINFAREITFRICMPVPCFRNFPEFKKPGSAQKDLKNLYFKLLFR